jgi:microcystin-dependent protein
MPLETASFINGLNANNPVATDGLADADNHLRLIKSAIKNTFPNLSGAVSATQADLSAIAGTTSPSSTTLTNSDALVVNDGGAMVQVTLSQLLTYLQSNLGITSSNIIDGSIQGADIANATITGDKLAAGSLFTAGMIVPYAGSSAPTGWLMCYGQDVSRTIEANLFAAIGVTYGAGDSTTTFNVPDLRGRVIAGQDDMGSISANRLTGQTGGLNGDTLGATGGAETHTLSEAELAAHRHFAVKDSSRGVGGGYVALTNSNSIIRYSIDPDWTQPQENATSYSLEGISGDADIGRTSATGSGNAHNNVQPTMILNYIIKT